MENILVKTGAREERLDNSAASRRLIGVVQLREPVPFTHRIASPRMTVLILIALVLATASVVGGMAQSSVPDKPLNPLEQTLIASEKSLIEAKKKDDAVLFKRVLTEDFALVGVDGKLLQRQEAVDELGDSGLVELTPYDIKVVMAGEAAAIVTYDAILRKKPEEDQGPPPRYQHFSSVWVKQGDGWKLKFHQATAAHWGDW